jgi:hypothetical protein
MKETSNYRNTSPNLKFWILMTWLFPQLRAEALKSLKTSLKSSFWEEMPYLLHHLKWTESIIKIESSSF